MGKAQGKQNTRRHNPIRVPDSHIPRGLTAAASTSKKADSILPIIQKIESSDATDRAFACAAISNLIYNDPSTRRLLQGNNIINVLIGKLSDSVEDVVVEASGALRNLAIDGGYEICGEMYNKNILAPMTPYVPKIASAMSTFLSGPPASSDRNLVFQLAENLITLFWCLSETSNKSLNTINNVGLIPFLVSFLEHRTRLPLSLVNAAAQCIYVLSDENTPAIEALRADKSSHISTLLFIVQSDPVTGPNATHGKSSPEIDIVWLRVLVCGILKNISPIPAKATGGERQDLDKNVILPILTPLLNVSLGDASNAVEAIASQPDPKIPPHLQNVPGSDHKPPNELELERIEAQLRTVQLALEILAGVCASLPDVEDDGGSRGEPEKGENSMEIDGADDEGEDQDEEEDELATVDREDMSDNDASHVGTPVTLLSLSTPLLVLITPTPLSFPPPSLPSLHPPTTSVLGAIHIAALECLNNLFVKIEGQGEGKSDESVVKGAEGVWSGVWSALGNVNGVGRPEVVFGAQSGLGTERRREAWAGAAGVLWGLARVCKGSLVPDSEQVQILMQLYDVVTEEKVKVQCIGTLGCIAQNTGAVEANKSISQYLMNVIKTGTMPEPTLQAVSEIIDIYSDETSTYDHNFRQGGYLSVLAERLGAMRKMVKRLDVKKPGGKALKRWGDGVVINLGDFVKYRRQLKL